MTVRFVSVVGGDTTLLPYALAHYRRLGVDRFHVVRHVERRDDPSLPRSREVMRRAGLEFVRLCVSPWHEDLNAALIREVMAAHPDDWWVVADLDEFHVYDRPLREVVAHCERRGHDHVEGAILDRVAADGRLTGPAPHGGPVPLHRQYPLAGLLTTRLLNARATKVTLARGTVELDLGQHVAWNGSPAPVAELHAQVHHFKWTASVRRRLARRVSAYESGEWRLLHRSVPGESRAVLTHLERHGGRIDTADPALGLLPCSMEYADYPGWRRLAAELSRHFASVDAPRRAARQARLAATAPGGGPATAPTDDGGERAP
ncbi:glycosyltransferase family 2 protein [Streptomyces sp. 4N509B]|uniref:glycosyltransferase family 2 protein n=1 Tax=Streptomyces sp. 4N509B TaxID=3457413 RepID=UPI003FD3200A